MADTPSLSIKICGIRDAQAAEAACGAGADLIGVVFVPGSARQVTPETVKEIRDVIAGRARLVGLFADGMDAAEIARVADAADLDLVQWHGAPAEGIVPHLEQATQRPVLAAVSVTDGGALAPDALTWTEAAEMLVLDAPPADRATHVRGGHGRTFDWAILRESAPIGRSFLLAGGLTPHNVAAAIAVADAHPGFAGVDVSSGVERTRGVKDAELIARFVGAARDADRRRGPAASGTSS